MDIRDAYYNMTGDYESAYGRDDTSGYIYSDDSIQRAVDAMTSTDNIGERGVIDWSIDKFGPRAGAAIGPILGSMSPQGGYWGVMDYMSDRGLAKGEEPYPEQQGDISRANRNLSDEIFGIGPRHLGAQYGILEYLTNKFMGRQ